MRSFRLLRPDEIECRVARFTEKSVQLLLYKTARTDAALLDETVGWMNWKTEYKTIDGKLVCRIYIWNPEIKEWIYKENAGTESNMEAVKGEFSDAQKRAGFVWGIGAELYSSPQIFVPISKTTAKNGKCFDDFKVSSIGYDKAENINALVISLNGQPVWNMGSASKKSLNDLVAEKTAEPSDNDLPFVFNDEPGGEPEVFSGKPRCSACGAEISTKVADFSKDKYGRQLCMNCQKKQR